MKKLEGYTKGINLGGWLSQGKEDKEHLDTFIVKSDLEKIASWKVDHVRLPVDFNIIETPDGSALSSGCDYIDSCISWCRELGLNMILDLHKTAGYTFDNQKESADFFTSQELQDRFITLWDRLSARYAKDSDIVIFELLNEVVDPNVADKWNEISARCIKTIRKNAPAAKIIVGGVDYNSITMVKTLAPPADENIIYTFHCYDPLVFTHQAAYWVETMPLDFSIPYPADLDFYISESLRVLEDRSGFLLDKKFGFTELGTDFFEKLFKEAIEVAEERNVALYCGEYGVIDRTSPEDAVRWYKDINRIFNKYGIGRAAWTYKGLDFGLTDKHYDSVRDELVSLL